MNRLPCQQADPDLFFAEPGTADCALAKQLCATCPIRVRCAEDAATRQEPYGVFGGLDETERQTASLWTTRSAGGHDEEDRALIADRRRLIADLADDGVTVEVIAAHLGVTASIVRCDLSRLRRQATLDRYPTTAERIEAAARGEDVTLTHPERAQVADTLDDGTRSVRLVARLAQVSPSTIRARRRNRREQVAA
jgi:hypothetical protein